MLKVYIADDEEVVRQGLKKIINWEQLGFEVCGEANNGLTAYNEIRQLSPDLILLDIRMPKLEGLDLASQLRKEGFSGRIIVLSGYSEFKYAQAAIECDVDSYLTKPIDEDDLLKVVEDIRQELQKKKLHTEHLSYYQEKAKYKILEEMIKEDSNSLASLNYSLGELDLVADLYQVLIIESVNNNDDGYKQLCEDLKVPESSHYLEKLKIESFQVILLKGEFIIGRFYAFKARNSIKEGHKYFIAAGNTVAGINDIYYSYHEALAVFERQFLFNESKFIAGSEDLPVVDSLTEVFNADISRDIARQIYEHIKIYNYKEASQSISNLKSRIVMSKNSAISIKSFLTGMYLFIIQEFQKDYNNYDLKFLSNAEIIQKVHNYRFLNDILQFIEDEVTRMINTISNFSSDSILDEIIEYINYHYKEDIKLKTLAPKFGYNSSYLGKIFSKKMKISFNDYLHSTRTEKGKELLLNKEYKVYEVSRMVGYKNVDYFHLKFKQYMDCTPNEFRQAHSIYED